MIQYIKQISSLKVFYCGLSLKILLGTFFASNFLSKLFIPFVDFFASDFANPYEKFSDVDGLAHFPYPALMLYLLAIPQILFGWIAQESYFFTLFLYRLPLLLADLLIFLVIKSWFPKKYEKRLIWFYWLSPVLIYISYIHGQLDVIPISLLFASLYFLFKEKLFFSALLLGASLATKTNVALIYPFFLLFLLSKNINGKKTSLFFIAAITTFIVINWPYIFNQAFLKMVFLNAEQAKLFSTKISLGELTLYLIPSSLLILFLRGAMWKKYNRDIFIMFLGFAFSIILLFIPPAQGWYFWLLPFLSYFYIRTEHQIPFLFFGLQAFYLLYFLLINTTDFFQVFQWIAPSFSTIETPYRQLQILGLNPQRLVSVVFTALQTTLLINCFWIYKKGLRSYTKHKIASSPFLIGIGGNSAAGKSTISDALAGVFSKNNITMIKGDDMHRWERKHAGWNSVTHLDPRGNYLHKEIDFLKKLKSNKKVYRRHYDHNSGTFTSAQVLLPKNLIIYDGLHPFYLASQRILYDLKIFVQPAIELSYHWKIIRDIKKRGYSKREVLAAIKKRETDSKKYINTQLDHADIVIEILPTKKIKKIGDAKEKILLSYKMRLPNGVYIEPVLTALQQITSLDISHEYTKKDHQIIFLKGDCSSKMVAEIAEEYIDGLTDLGISNPQWPPKLLAALLLLLTYFIFEKADYDKE